MVIYYCVCVCPYVCACVCVCACTYSCLIGSRWTKGWRRMELEGQRGEGGRGRREGGRGRRERDRRREGLKPDIFSPCPWSAWLSDTLERVPGPPRFWSGYNTSSEVTTVLHKSWHEKLELRIDRELPPHTHTLTHTDMDTHWHGHTHTHRNTHTHIHELKSVLAV